MSRGGGWQFVFYVGAVVWLGQISGNAAMGAAHPSRHWPLLESADALGVVLMLPAALLLRRLTRESAFSLPLAVTGILGMVASTAITVGFETELAAFGAG